MLAVVPVRIREMSDFRKGDVSRLEELPVGEHDADLFNMVDHASMFDGVRTTAIVAEHTADHANVSAARVWAELPMLILQPILQLIEHNADAATNSAVTKEFDVFEMMREIQDHRFANRIAREAGTSAAREYRDFMFPTDSGRRPDVVDGFGPVVEAGGGTVEVKRDLVPSCLCT
mgnify:CR=1 FL=1